jgi:predicted  nucleic acid-binding Zn-ribbon protein
MSPKNSSDKETKDPIEIELEVIKTPMGLVPSVEGLHKVVERLYQEIQTLKIEHNSFSRLLAEQVYALETFRSELEEIRGSLRHIGPSIREELLKITAHISALESTIEDQVVGLELKIKTLEKQWE